MRIRSLLSGLTLAGCLASAVAPVVFGQEERPQRGQGGGPGGRGGPGGMLGGLGGMLGGMGGLAGTLGIEEVQKHLKMDETQQNEFKEARTSLQDDMRKIMEEMRGAAGQGGGQGGGGRGFGGGFSEETRKKMSELTGKLDSKIEDILDPSQFDRLLGLFAQQAGINALGNKHIVDRLVITDDQKSKIKELQDESGAKVREMFTGGGGRPGPEMFEKMTAMRKESEEKIMGVLTADQKKKLDELKGEKFEFPQGPGFGGGGFGGPGGRGNRGDRGNN